MPHGAIRYPFGQCRICEDNATGVHYGVATCEGCKGFFKRSLPKYHKYKCYFGGQCDIGPRNRNRCKACRFKRCMLCGMSIEGIKMGRIPKLQKEHALEVATANDKGRDGDVSESINEMKSHDKSPMEGTSSSAEPTRPQSATQPESDDISYGMTLHRTSMLSLQPQFDRSPSVEYLATVDTCPKDTDKSQRKQQENFPTGQFDWCRETEANQSNLRNETVNSVQQNTGKTLFQPTDRQSGNRDVRYFPYRKDNRGSSNPHVNPAGLSLSQHVVTSPIERNSQQNPFGREQVTETVNIPSLSSSQSVALGTNQPVRSINPSNTLSQHDVVGCSQSSRCNNQPNRMSCSRRDPVGNNQHVRSVNPPNKLSCSQRSAVATRTIDQAQLSSSQCAMLGGNQIKRNITLSDVSASQQRSVATNPIQSEDATILQNNRGPESRDSPTPYSKEIIRELMHQVLNSPNQIPYKKIEQFMTGLVGITDSRPTDRINSAMERLQQETPPLNLKTQDQHNSPTCHLGACTNRQQNRTYVGERRNDANAQYTLSDNNLNARTNVETTMPVHATFQPPTDSDSGSNSFAITNTAASNSSGGRSSNSVHNSYMSCLHNGELQSSPQGQQYFPVDDVDCIKNEFSQYLCEQGSNEMRCSANSCRYHDQQNSGSGDMFQVHTVGYAYKDSIPVSVGSKLQSMSPPTPSKISYRKHIAKGVETVFRKQLEKGVEKSSTVQQVTEPGFDLTRDQANPGSETENLPQETSEVDSPAFQISLLNMKGKFWYHYAHLFFYRKRMKLRLQGIRMPNEELPVNEENKKIIWKLLMNSVAETNERIVGFSAAVPGFTKLPSSDQQVLAKRVYFDLWMITHHTFLQENGESHLMFTDGTRYQREWMDVILPQKLIKEIFVVAKAFNDLQLTDDEIVYLCAVTVTSSNGVVIQDVEHLKKLHERMIDVFAAEVTKNHTNGGRLLINVFTEILPKLEVLNGNQDKVIGNFEVDHDEKILEG